MDFKSKNILGMRQRINKQVLSIDDEYKIAHLWKIENYYDNNTHCPVERTHLFYTRKGI